GTGVCAVPVVRQGSGVAGPGTDQVVHTDGPLAGACSDRAPRLAASGGACPGRRRLQPVDTVRARRCPRIATAGERRRGCLTVDAQPDGGRGVGRRVVVPGGGADEAVVAGGGDLGRCDEPQPVVAAGTVLTVPQELRGADCAGPVLAHHARWRR